LIVKNFLPLSEVSDDAASVQDKIPGNDSAEKKEEVIDVQMIGVAKSRYGFFFAGFKLVIPQDHSLKQL
jgi:hypothetical protein